MQAHRQHIESARQNVAAVEVSAQLAQRLSWNDARREYKLYLHSTLMDIHNGRAEARRDAWEQVCVCVGMVQRVLLRTAKGWDLESSLSDLPHVLYLRAGCCLHSHSPPTLTNPPPHTVYPSRRTHAFKRSSWARPSCSAALSSCSSRGTKRSRSTRGGSSQKRMRSGSASMCFSMSCM